MTHALWGGILGFLLLDLVAPIGRLGLRLTVIRRVSRSTTKKILVHPGVAGDIRKSSNVSLISSPAHRTAKVQYHSWPIPLFKVVSER